MTEAENIDKDTAWPIFFVGLRKTGTTAFFEVLRLSGLQMPKDVKQTFFSSVLM